MARSFAPTLLAALVTLGLAGQDTAVKMLDQQIEGPATPQAFEAWIADLRHWRDEQRVRMGFDDADYRRPDLAWTRSSFVQPQLMVEDRFFYDPVAGRYTVDRYLDDLEVRYGGIDAVLVWAVYCNIGVDERNQQDMVRSLPGGIPGVRAMVDAFHRRGVKVLFPVMPWDRGTRDEGRPLWEATAELMKAVGADGLNGDTCFGLPEAYRKASDTAGHPLALEPEPGVGGLEQLRYNTLSWGYWEYPLVPMVSKYKWLAPGHMVNVCDRWARDHSDHLQAAFFNGVGFESWENIWGIWNQLTARDAEALRRVATLERAMADLLASPAWEPHTPTLQTGVFASRFDGKRESLWTMVNRSTINISGPQLQVPRQAGMRYFDLYHGVELVPERRGEAEVLSFDVEGKGFGAVLATPDPALRGTLPALLARMKALTSQPLAAFSRAWNPLPQTLVPAPALAPVRKAPSGMVRIPGAAAFEFQVSGVEIEGDNEPGVDVQYPWEDAPRRHHRSSLTIKPFYMDRHPVTNRQFKAFLDASRYRPGDAQDFLKDWKNGTYPEGWADRPVTWVSLEDARAYCAWTGRRLPHEWEWQYAAQGLDGRAYPWGSAWDPQAVPEPCRGRNRTPPDPVGRHPRGASPFGVEDLVGHVWQWTDEFQDLHTRAAILRGGSHYQPQGSSWYFPQATRLTEHGKYLLMAPSKDRSGTIGFRTVADAAE